MPLGEVRREQTATFRSILRGVPRAPGRPALAWVLKNGLKDCIIKIRPDSESSRQLHSDARDAATG